MKKIFLAAFFLVSLVFLAVALSAPPTRAEGDITTTCSLSICHKALKGITVYHKPVKTMECLLCHVRTGNHPMAGAKETMKLVEEGATLCYRCHKKFPDKKSVHGPVKSGECTSCHNPHGSTGKNLIDADNGQTPFCTGCHDAKLFSGEVVHGPVATGECTACHEPHQADAGPLLRDKVPGLCYRCHPDISSAMQGAAVVHPPVKEGKCMACHEPHRSPSKYLLKDVPVKFCVTCHKGVGKTVAAAKYQHGPMVQTGGCLGCHSGHVSAAKALLPATGKDVCLKCHPKVAESYEGKKSVHGPIRQGKCAPCHDPHGSAFAKLLKGPYPDALYVPHDPKKKTYDFCLKCHNKYLLSYPDTTINTRFRNGKSNLHYFHVTNSRKGRTCRLCHEPHGSDAEHLITVGGLRFGEWRVPIGFVPTPTGGSCSPGCHGTYTYERPGKKK